MEVADYTQQKLIEQRSLDFCRWVSCRYKAARFYGTESEEMALKIFAETYPRREATHDLIQKHLTLRAKAAIGAATTTDANWAGPLASVTPRELVEGFLPYVRPLTLL